MIACATSVPRITLPESGIEPTTERAVPDPRTDGMSDGPSPRRIRVLFATGKEELAVEGWCREQVWTTLQNRAAISFVVRESWSRLGKRKAQRLARTKDAVFQGVLVRLRPTTDGHVDFVVEISTAHVGPEAEKYEWQGESFEMPRPVQDGYRFEGRVPAGYSGPVASWGELSVRIEDSLESTAIDPKVMRFAVGDLIGSVTHARGGLAEFYRIRTERLEPIERDHSGIVQALFRLKRKRVAAGFYYDDKKEWVFTGDDSLSILDD